MYNLIMGGDGMDFIAPISEVRGNLPALIKKIKGAGKHLVITKNGKAEAVLLTPEQLETLEVRADSALMRSLIRAQEDIKAGRLRSHQDVFKGV